MPFAAPDPRTLLAIAAAAAPSLLAYNLSPSPTLLNQALAIGLWGAFVAVTLVPGRSSSHGAWSLFAALVIVAAAVFWSWGPGSLPAGLALSALGLLACVALLVWAGASQHQRAEPAPVFAAFCAGWVVAGVANAAVAAAQVFAPDWVDGDWIAHSGLPGRAVGNLRQPNHLSSVLLWAAIAVLALAELRVLQRLAAALLFVAMLVAVVLTASRTGLVSVALLALWGLFDRRLAAPTRALLLAAPLVYALAWFGLAQWAEASQHTFGGSARLAESDISGSRFAIWRDTLVLIRQHLSTGVGFGEFNLAWTLTVLPNRPVAFFDHTHNLPLQLLVELGLPLGGLVIVLLLLALAAAAWRAFRDPGDTGLARRAALLMVLMIGLHSQLEYPLWYSYFLLPTAFAWGFALGFPARVPQRGDAVPPIALAFGALMLAGAALTVADYLRVAAIFGSAPGAAPLEQRIASGQRSLLFGHHADYAAVTTAPAPPEAFARPVHYLLDTRLMLAWARSLEAAGRVDEARFLADRLREFRNPNAKDFFAECDAAPAGALPFQCERAAGAPPWRTLIRP